VRRVRYFGTIKRKRGSNYTSLILIEKVNGGSSDKITTSKRAQDLRKKNAGILSAFLRFSSLLAKR
jgi:hypothetical protein